MSIVQGSHSVPVLVDIPYGREDIMVLPEVIGGFIPGLTIVHHVAFCLVVAACIANEIIIGIGREPLIKTVITSESHFVQVLVGLDTCITAIGAVHQTEVVITGSNSVPCLSCLFEVTDVLVSDNDIIGKPTQSSVVAA